MRKPVGWEDTSRTGTAIPFLGGLMVQQMTPPEISLEPTTKFTAYTNASELQTAQMPPSSLPPHSASSASFLSIQQHWAGGQSSWRMTWHCPRGTVPPGPSLRPWASHQMYASLWAVLSKAGRHFFKKEQVDTGVLGTPLLLLVTANSYCMLMLHAVLI